MFLKSVLQSVENFRIKGRKPTLKNFGFKKYLFSDQYVKSVEWKKLTNVNQGTIIKERFEIIHLPSGKKHASKK